MPIADLSKDYGKQALEDQKAFIADLGPYSKTVDKKDRGAFFERIYHLWFVRWKLDVQNFEGDVDFMKYRRSLIEKVRFQIHFTRLTIFKLAYYAPETGNSCHDVLASCVICGD